MKKIILFISLSLLILVGCSVKKGGNSTCTDVDNNRTIWVNQKVECCGVNDPLNNLEWLKEDYDRVLKLYEQTESVSYVYYCYFFLFRNDLTSINYIVRKSTMWKYSNFMIYECDGTIVDMGVFYDESNPNKMLGNNTPDDWYEDPPYNCISCNSFFKTHTLVDTIFYFVIQP
ncbi:MAG: hypothetical protein IKV26_09510 [Paludibacteraceae bacterium]|nr:hypothetical protein [Paludibacteraceae bacterium]